MKQDWRYSDEKMKVRAKALEIILKKYGNQMENNIPKYSNQYIY